MWATTLLVSSCTKRLKQSLSRTVLSSIWTVLSFATLSSSFSRCLDSIRKWVSRLFQCTVSAHGINEGMWPYYFLQNIYRKGINYASKGGFNKQILKPVCKTINPMWYTVFTCLPFVQHFISFDIPGGVFCLNLSWVRFQVRVTLDPEPILGMLSIRQEYNPNGTRFL